MGILKTRRRLERAKFFLGKMEEHAHGALLFGPRDRDMEVFRHYLGAFIDAARSVPWAYQSENKPLYQNVHPHWDASLTEGDRALLDLTNDHRLD